jgi:hypothetical protein
MPVPRLRGETFAQATKKSMICIADGTEKLLLLQAKLSIIADS